MKKIVIIEDTEGELEKFKELLVDSELVDCSNDISAVYDTSKKEFRSEVEYEYVIIHHSFNQKGVTSEIIGDLKEYVNNNFPYKLITYSGGASLSKNLTNLEQYVFYIPRKIVKRNIVQFVQFSQQVNDWYLPALFFGNYQQRFLKSSYYKLKRKFDQKLALKCLSILGYDGIEITEENKDKVINQIKMQADD